MKDGIKTINMIRMNYGNKFSLIEPTEDLKLLINQILSDQQTFIDDLQGDILQYNQILQLLPNHEEITVHTSSTSDFPLISIIKYDTKLIEQNMIGAEQLIHDTIISNIGYFTDKFQGINKVNDCQTTFGISRLSDVWRTIQTALSCNSSLIIQYSEDVKPKKHRININFLEKLIKLKDDNNKVLRLYQLDIVKSMMIEYSIKLRAFNDIIEYLIKILQ
jgi:hypothetical protein